MDPVWVFAQYIVRKIPIVSATVQEIPAPPQEMLQSTKGTSFVMAAHWAAAFPGPHSVLVD